MSDQHDERFVTQLRDALEDETRELDPVLAARLREARARALAGKRRRNHSMWRYSPALGFACSLILVIALLHEGPIDHSQSPPGDPMASDFVEEALDYDGNAFPELASVPSDVSSTDIELIEDLEFFEWLEASGYAG